MAISGAKNTFKLKVKHTSSAHYKLQQVTKLFSNVNNYFDKFEAIALAMQDTPFTQEQMKKLAEVMHPVPKKQPKKSNDEVLADLEKGKAILGDMVNRASSEQRAMDALINKEKISTEVPKRIQKQRDELVKLFNKGTGNSGKTAFDAINALTEGKQHNEVLGNYKNTDSSTPSENRFMSVMQGTAKKYTDTGFEKILEMVDITI
jgi:CRISPR/Cas system CSM-associated protein Csm2 small subunit